MQVLDERKARGIADTVGRARRPSATAATTHPRRGAARKAERRPRRCAQGGLCCLCPPIVDRYLNEHLFCDIFERDLLTWQERELAAVAILTALGEGAPADAAVALRHLPAPGSHGWPAPPDDENRKRAERRRRPLARGMLMPDNPNFAGGGAWLQGYAGAQDGFDCTVAVVTFAPGAVTVGTAMREGSSCCAPPAGATTRRKASRYDCCSRGDVVKIL